jgi:hypothetical protein
VRRTVVALAALCVLSLIAGPAEAGKRHHKHKPAGVDGVVLDSSCYGACVQPQAPPPVYPGTVTVTVHRVADGATVAGSAVSDGHFRFKLQRGLYDVSSVPPNPPTCQPQPQAQQICPPPCTPTKEIVCPLVKAPEVIVAPCLTGETKRVAVRRHRFTHVELHVTNACIV